MNNIDVPFMKEQRAIMADAIARGDLDPELTQVLKGMVHLCNGLLEEEEKKGCYDE